MNIANRVKVYIRANDIEKSAKERKQQIKNLTKIILQDKTAKQAIEYHKDLTRELNIELLKVFKQSNEDVEAISSWVKDLK
jgi:nitrogenase subunit NifH